VIRLFAKNPIARALRHTRRFRQIARILIRYGFSEFLDTLKLGGTKGLVGKILPKKEKELAQKYTRWQRLRMVLEELGPTFIKFGQIISARHDLLPDELIDELSKLQDEVPPFESRNAVEIIEKELEAPLAEIFQSFEEVPEASASIAQMHRARLANGTEAAVKVRRPGIEEVIRTDIEILENLAYLTERYLPNAHLFNPHGLVQEFKEQIERELNFTLELLNVEKFQALLGDEEHLRLPGTRRDYSTEKVLTLEYIPGTRLARILENPAEYENSEMLGDRMADLLLKQIFEKGFFHADPHPGNLLVLESAKICYLDFGMMGTINDPQRERLSTLMFGISKRNSELVTRTLLEMTTAERPVDREALEFRVFQLLERYVDLPLQYVDVRSIFSDLTDIVLSFRLRMPRNLNLMIKTLVMMEGIGRKLNPEFQIIEKIEPYATGLFARKFHPRALWDEFSLSSLDYGKLFKEFPVRTRDLLEQLTGGDIRLNMRFIGLEAMRFVLDAVSNRLVFGLILAALLISSSMVLLSGVPPVWRDIPIIGLAGYLVSAVMGLVFIFSWFRKKAKRRRSRDALDGTDYA
jgi:ubiquinone biosynthesis protein